MYNKKVVFILVVLITFVMVINVGAEEKPLSEMVYEKIKNYEKEVEQGEDTYDKLVRDQGISQKRKKYSHFGTGYNYYKNYSSDFYNDKHSGFNYEEYETKILGEYNKYNKVEIPIKYSNRYGHVQYKILRGYPVAKYQFSSDFKFVFKLSPELGLVLKTSQIETIYDSNKVYEIKELIELGDITYLNY